MAVKPLSRFFAMARGEHFHALTGWYVCDSMDQDKNFVAKPIHKEPMSERDARALAKEYNDRINKSDSAK